VLTVMVLHWRSHFFWRSGIRLLVVS